MTTFKGIEAAKTTFQVAPHWTPETAPSFLRRTDVQYARLPLSTLSDRGIENRLFDNLREYLPEGAVIAGGFMTSVLQDDKNASDIDVFFTSEKAFRETMNLLNDPPEEAWGWSGYKLDTDLDVNSQSLRFVKWVHVDGKRPPIQLVKIVWYEDPTHVIDSFDLTIAQVAATSDALWVNPLTPMDLVRKRIVLHRMQFPASTLRRLIKYAQKGYYACPGALARIAEEIATAVANDPDDTRRIVYVD